MSVGQHVTAALVALVAASLGVVALNVLYQLVRVCAQGPNEPHLSLTWAAFAVTPLFYCAFPLRLLHASLALQLAPRDPRRPPVVFHYVPIIGCAVSYGMDPYKFMFDCREKVRALSCSLLVPSNTELTRPGRTNSTDQCSRTRSLASGSRPQSVPSATTLS